MLHACFSQGLPLQDFFRITSASGESKTQRKLFNLILIVNVSIMCCLGVSGCPVKDLSVSSTELPTAYYLRGVQVLPESQDGTAKVMVSLTQTYRLCQNKFLGWMKALQERFALTGDSCKDQDYKLLHVCGRQRPHKVLGRNPVFLPLSFAEVLPEFSKAKSALFLQ